MALFVTIYMSVMGKEGVKKPPRRLTTERIIFAKNSSRPSIFLFTFDKPFFNEFCVRYDGDADKLYQTLLDNGILGGIKISDHDIMFAVTENAQKKKSINW